MYKQIPIKQHWLTTYYKIKFKDEDSYQSFTDFIRGAIVEKIKKDKIKYNID